MTEICETWWFNFEGVHALFLWICPAFRVLKKSPAGTTDFFECFLVISKQTNLTQFLPKAACHLQTQFRLLSKLFQTCKFLSKSAASASPYHVSCSLGWERLHKQAKMISNFRRTIYVQSMVRAVSGQLFILPPLAPTLQFTMETWTKECSRNGYSHSGHTTLKTRLRDLFVQEHRPSTFTMC